MPDEDLRTTSHTVLHTRMQMHTILYTDFCTIKAFSF